MSWGWWVLVVWPSSGIGVERMRMVYSLRGLMSYEAERKRMDCLYLWQSILLRSYYPKTCAFLAERLEWETSIVSVQFLCNWSWFVEVLDLLSSPLKISEWEEKRELDLTASNVPDLENAWLFVHRICSSVLCLLKFFHLVGEADCTGLVSLISFFRTNFYCLFSLFAISLSRSLK